MTFAKASVVAPVPIPSRHVVVEWSLRLCAIASYGYMLAGMIVSWSDTGRPYSMLALMLTEAFTLGLILFAIPATRRDASPLLVLAVTYTSGFALLLDNTDARHFIPDAIAASLQWGGLGLTLASKAWVGRAFGILPAARRLVTSGPYGWVRHPMYLGYMIGNVGFLLANASLRNLLVMSALLLVQVLRILSEERVFSQSEFGPAFDTYRTRVRFRLVPYLF